MTKLYVFYGPRIDVPDGGIPAADLLERLTAWLQTVPEEHQHTARIQCSVSGCGGDYCLHEFEFQFAYSRPLTRLEAWRDQPEVRQAEVAAATAAGDLTNPFERGDKYWPPMPPDWQPPS